MLNSRVNAVLRVLLWPFIRAVGWSINQSQAARNARLLRQIDAVDRKSVALYGEVRIGFPEKCRVGRGVAIHDANWNAAGGITIGDYVHFGPRVTIFTVSHDYESDALPYGAGGVYKPVVIEDCVWVGSDVVIAPGTHIGEGSVIAMGTVLSGRIPMGSVVGSAPWRVLKQRDMGRYDALKRSGTFR